MQPLGYEDKASIAQTIDDEVLLRKSIEFRSTSVQSAGDRMGVEGELTLVGETRPIAFDLEVGDGGRLSGSVVVTQSNWGMTPYSGLFGALKVADDVEVTIDAALPSAGGRSALTYDELVPRALKPALLDLEGISRLTVLAHHELYAGYVGKRNAILAQLAGGERDLRGLKIELTFAIGGIKSHELYFEHLGGEGGNPAGAVRRLIERDFGSAEAWRADLKASGMSGRGWAWTAYDWDEGRLANYVGDAQNTFPVWNATPLIALDVDEHSYVLDFGTDRAAYIDAFFANLDWGVVNDLVWRHRIPLTR
jgi:Fe-Mn family superoxide dismutase